MKTDETIGLGKDLIETINNPKLGAITLDEMDSIKLMNRIDSKFVTETTALKALLEKAADRGYRILENLGDRITPYKSLYFDTEDLEMYIKHENKKLVRQKVRTRMYINSGVTFLEIKRKNNKGRTKKKRMEVPKTDYYGFSSNVTACDFLADKSWYKAFMLSPALETIFKRITLVNKAKTERVTIDMNLTFVNSRTGKQDDIGNAVIIELKQDGRAQSDLKKILWELRIHPLRVSKYCIGTALTDPNIKKGRFKAKIRAIDKIRAKALLKNQTK